METIFEFRDLFEWKQKVFNDIRDFEFIEESGLIMEFHFIFGSYFKEGVFLFWLINFKQIIDTLAKKIELIEITES